MEINDMLILHNSLHRGGKKAPDLYQTLAIGPVVFNQEF